MNQKQLSWPHTSSEDKAAGMGQNAHCSHIFAFLSELIAPAATAPRAVICQAHVHVCDKVSRGRKVGSWSAMAGKVGGATVKTLTFEWHVWWSDRGRRWDGGGPRRALVPARLGVQVAPAGASTAAVCSASAGVEVSRVKYPRPKCRAHTRTRP